MKLKAVMLLTLTLLVLLPTGALAHGTATEPRHTEVVEVGPYKLVLEFDTWPLAQAKNFQVVVHPHGGTDGLKGTLSLTPGPGVQGRPWNKVALRSYPGVDNGWLFQAPGAFGAGRWDWEFQIEGPQGSASKKITLRFDEAPPFPIWLGWVIGLTPFWGLVWFGFRERRRIKAQSSSS